MTVVTFEADNLQQGVNSRKVKLKRVSKVCGSWDACVYGVVVREAEVNDDARFAYLAVGDLKR